MADDRFGYGHSYQELSLPLPDGTYRCKGQIQIKSVERSSFMGWQEKQVQRILQKMGSNVTGLSDLVGDTYPSALFYFLADKLAYLMSGEPERVLSQRTVRIRRKINKIIKVVGPLFLERRQMIESKNALLGIDKPDESIDLPREAVIWCPNHGFKDDVLATVLACRHAYILFGSLPDYFNTFDGITSFLNGVVMCNRKVAASRRASVENAKRVMAMGADLLMYPEGVWNKTPDKLILPLWPGAVRIAGETGCRIVPVIHYLADPHKKYKGNVIHTVVADPISMEGLTEEEGLALLRDTMATWYFLLMKRYGQTTRQALLEGYENADDAWEDYIAMHTGLIQYYDREIELKADYRPKAITRPEDVWRPIAAIQNITPKNARHVLYARQLVAREEKRDFQRKV